MLNIWKTDNINNAVRTKIYKSSFPVLTPERKKTVSAGKIFGGGTS